MPGKAARITGPLHSAHSLTSEAISPSALGRAAGMLITVLSLISIPITSVLVPPQHRVSSYISTVVSITVGIIAWKAPWDRWRPIATVSIPIVSLGFVGAGIYYGNRPESFALFFVVVFAWTGIAHPPGTSTWMSPFAVAAYVVPILAKGGGFHDAILAAYYVPVAVLTGEALAFLAQRLRRSEASMRKLDQLKNEFIALVAHDMRTPIVIIRGFAERLRDPDDIVDPDTREEYVRTIERNAKRASEFVENLLQFARIETDEFRQSARPFDLDALITLIANDLQNVQKTATIKIRMAPNLEQALADEERNAQVVANLLSNALKFSPPGGTIDVAVERWGEMLRVSVHDQGPGISKTDVDKLFMKFSTLEARDDVKRAAGTGLGLYISRQIVEGQGGRIWIESKPGSGTTFFYTVPIAPSSNGKATDGRALQAEQSFVKGATL